MKIVQASTDISMLQCLIVKTGDPFMLVRLANLKQSENF